MTTSETKLSDTAVDALPLHQGRAELLEEIMNTPVLDDTFVRRGTESRRMRYLVPLAAAAAVAALACAPLWAGGGDEPRAETNGFAAAPATGPTYLPVLDADGWRVTDAATDPVGGSVRFAASGERSLEVNWYVSDLYAGYVEDREHIVDPPAPGEPVEVAGVAGQMWAYSAADHTVIREVDDGLMLELRGEGMGRRAYLDLLGQVRLVDLESFEAELPGASVTTAERPAAVQEIVDGIAAALGPARGLTPPGTSEPVFETRGTDTYYLGADIAGAVACAWLDAYAEASEVGDTAGARDAAEALGTSRQWPILKEMDAEGDYPEVVWEYADRLEAGQEAGMFGPALGCP